MYLQEKSRFLLFPLIIFLLISLQNVSYAQKEEYVHKAIELKLFEKKYWSKLTLIQSNKKRVIDASFYFTKENNNLLYNELVATIEAFLKDNNTICRFPARYKWLNKYLNFKFEKFDLHQCDKLKEFRKKYFRNIDLMYTSERYNSPASLFGHIFLKTKTDTIDYAINYAALIPEDENRFVYVYKGLSGVYEGEYFLIPFARKKFEYNNSEFRDILEFKLQLSDEQKENIYFHLFELQNMKQAYYFITRNCSSEILHLIEIADEEFDFDKFISYEAVPYKIIERLNHLGILKAGDKYLSRLYKFYELIAVLSKEQQEILNSLLDYKIGVHNLEDFDLTKKEKYQIISAAIEYIEMKSAMHELDKKYVYPLIKLIQLKHEYEKQEVEKVAFEHDIYSTKYRKVYFEHASNSISDDYNLIGFRYLYRSRFDLLDKIERHGSIEVLNFELKQKSLDGDLKLKKFLLFDLESLPISNQYFSSYTTKMKFGIDEIWNDESKYWFFNYEKGKRVELKGVVVSSSLGMTGYYKQNSLISTSANIAVEKKFSHSFMVENKNSYTHFSNGLIQQSYGINFHVKLNNSSKLKFAVLHQEDLFKQNQILTQWAYFF